MRQGRRRRRVRERHPDERPLRERQRARRHVRAGRLRGVPPRLPRAGLDGEVGRPARGALHLDRLRHRVLLLASCSPAAHRRPRDGVTLAFAWARTRSRSTCSSSNTNDAIPPPFLDPGARDPRRRRWRAARRWRSPAGRSSRRCSCRSGPCTRGRCAAGATWASTRRAARAGREPSSARLRWLAELGPVGAVAYALGCRWLDCADALLPGAVSHFWHATSAASSTASRRSRSGTGGQLPRRAARPAPLQRALEVALLVGGAAPAFVPRRKTPLQLAALTAPLLIGFELVLTHWFYLYIPWFFPFVALALFAPPRRA